jgi:hypothetical protein
MTTQTPSVSSWSVSSIRVPVRSWGSSVQPARAAASSRHCWILGYDSGLDVLTAMTLAWRVLAVSGRGGFVGLRLPQTTQVTTDRTRSSRAPSVLWPVRAAHMSEMACVRFRLSRGITVLGSNWKELV